jgi:acyl-CoA-binding protein
LQQFNQAAADVKNLTKRPSDSELLELYALFKQATVGDNNTGNQQTSLLTSRGTFSLINKLAAYRNTSAHYTVSTTAHRCL